MDFLLKTNDGDVKLRFSNYFLHRICKLSGKTLTDATLHIAGDISGERAKGGILDDLEVRAIVIAAGIDAHNMAKGNFTETSTIEGFRILEKVPNALTNIVWAEMYTEIMKSIMPEKLGDKKPSKKKAIKKTSH